MKYIILFILFAFSFTAARSQTTMRYTPNPTNHTVKPVKVTYKRIGYSKESIAGEQSSQQSAHKNATTYASTKKTTNTVNTNKTITAEQQQTIPVYKPIANSSSNAKPAVYPKKGEKIKRTYKKIGPSTYYTDNLPTKP